MLIVPRTAFVFNSLCATALWEIELGHLEWGDTYQYVETAILSSHVSHVNQKKNVRKIADQILKKEFG
jgi:hypothetical protein